jgi:soluble lytic murein transglycosylase-like protein
LSGAQLKTILMDGIPKLLVWIAAAIVVFFALSDAYGKARPAESIPHLAYRYRRDLIGNARFVWGISAPTSTFGAQVHAESSWIANQCNRIGACGLGQITPGTRRWLAASYPALRPAAPLNPIWSLRAMLRYDLYLWDMAKGVGCSRMRLVLAGYNAGKGRMYKHWPAETRHYVVRVLNVLEPTYIQAGWGIGSCHQ